MIDETGQKFLDFILFELLPAELSLGFQGLSMTMKYWRGAYQS